MPFSADTTTFTVFVPGESVLAPVTDAITALLSFGLAATEMAVTSASTVAVYACVPAENAGLIVPGEMPRCARLLSEDLAVPVPEVLLVVVLPAELEELLPEPVLFPELEELLLLPPEELLLPLLCPLSVSVPAPGPATVS